MNIRNLCIFISMLLGTIGAGLYATPTTLFWTPCTTDVVATGDLVTNVDVLFSVFNRRGHGESLPTDVGLELGAFSWKDLHLEAGVDYLGGTDDPFYFNAKVGADEDWLFCNAPSFSFGIFSVGTRAHKTNDNVLDLIFGRSLPDFIGGRFYVGAFIGNKSLGKNQAGWMVGYSRGFCLCRDSCGREFYKYKLLADYASGKNNIGGGGIGLAYFFTPDINLQGGPVWFNTAKYNGSWKLLVQANFTVAIF